MLRLWRAVGRLRLYAVAQERADATHVFEERRVFDEGYARCGLSRARDEVVGDYQRIGLDVRDRAVLSRDDGFRDLRVGENRHVLPVALDVLLSRGDYQLLDLPHR